MGSLDNNSSMLLLLPQPSPTSPPQALRLAISYLNDPIKPMTHKYAFSETRHPWSQ